MSQIWDIYCKHCLWSIFGPCWCTKSCKTTFYTHLARIWKLSQFRRFIRKVFATKILLSGKFSLFVTLNDWYIWFSRFLWFRWKPPKNRNLCYIIRASSPHPPYLPDLCQLGIPTIDKLQSMVHLNQNVNRPLDYGDKKGYGRFIFFW